MTTATATKEIANKEDQLPSYIQQRDQGRGNENVGTDDLTLPRVDVLQALSPQINKKKDVYIDGAEQGMLFNTLTGELYGDGITIIPVYFRKQWLIWKDRDNGGGLRGVFNTSEEANNFIATSEENDIEAVETGEHLVLIVDGDKVTEAILSCAKSKLKVSRKLNSLVKLNGNDRFSRQYRVTPYEDEGQSGEYWNIAVANGQPAFPSEPHYRYAENLYSQITGGTREVKADNSSEY